MPDDRQQLHETLERLGRQLDESKSLDPAVASQVRETIQEVRTALADEQSLRPGLKPLTQRLSEAALEFEASHPTLAGTLGSVIDALGRMGI